jgi:hypothetical protein
MGAIGARFGIGASVGGGIGEGAADMAASAAGLVYRKPPIRTFSLPPGSLTGTSVGTYADIPGQWGPPSGWFWDLTSLTAYGFTAGTIAVTKNFPLVTAAGNPFGLEPVGSFAQAGVLAYAQHGIPLLDATERLVFTVTSTLTLAVTPGQVQFSGQVVAVPAERIDEYLS